MNKIYKVIFCKATQSWVAVSEMTKGQAKSSVRSILAGTTSSSVFGGRLKLLTLAVLLGLGFSQQTMAGQTPLHANDGADTNCVAINDVGLGSGVIGASNCDTYQVTDAEDISNKDRVSVYSDSKGQVSIVVGTVYIGNISSSG